MDFQRLFKRKEEVATHSMAGEHQKETLGSRSVSLSEGDLLDGQAPANLLWKNVGGTISVRADKILGILEGRTRIKGAVLQEIYPALFEKDPHPGTEFLIPLQIVVTQLEDVFAAISSGDLGEENFETPFGQLAREDDARFKEGTEPVNPTAKPIVLTGQPNGVTEGRNTPVREARSNGSVTVHLTQSPNGAAPVIETEATNGAPTGVEQKPVPSPDSIPALPIIDDVQGDAQSSTVRGTTASPKEAENRACQSLPADAKGEQSPYRRPRGGNLSSESPTGLRHTQNNDVRREWHEALQELFLTDEQLDGSKVADLVLQLPRVAGVVIMLADGAVLGGVLSGGLNESLLGLAPGFVQDLVRFTESMRGGPTRFVTLAGNACLISLTIAGQVLILVAHDGKNLPPGLRERLVATAHALNMIYGPRP